MLKKVFVIMIFLILILGGSALAAETYTTTSTINGVTVNWQYQLNESDQIKNLKCLNPAELTGSIGIPYILEGKTVVTIGDHAFASATGITEITIPDSVTKIEYSAFENCTNLTSVDLGKITAISHSVFTGCTRLAQITIPNTLKSGAALPCLNNPNITTITLEEGLTVVPSYICANTGITEITIPNSVTKIEYGAFNDCTNLKKITILDNVTLMDFYDLDEPEAIFNNHNADLTIYCYEDSMAAKYAIKYNIKYVYLNRTVDHEDETKEEEIPNKKQENVIDDTNKGTQGKDKTASPNTIPAAGINYKFILILFTLICVTVISYNTYHKYKQII